MGHDEMAHDEMVHGQGPVADEVVLADADGYMGISWAQRAGYGVFGAALDPADKTGRKNAYIDRLHRMALESALGRRRFERTLDFGCGPGRLLGLLACRSLELYALDRTPEMLAGAKALHRMPDERFVCWREDRLPFADEFFDLIVSVYVLGVMPRADLPRTLSELQRVCSATGQAVLIEQVDHARDLAPAAYHTLFRDAGFAQAAALPIRTRNSGFMRLATRRFLPRFFTQMLARAELQRRRSKRFGPATPGYWDYLFVLRKSSPCTDVSTAL